jgi:CBS domain-containing protein
MKVKDVMHPGGTLIAADTPLSQVAAIMGEEGVVPIGECDRLVGIVTEREIVARGVSDVTKTGNLTARDVMSKPLVYCYPEEEVDDALRIMNKHHVRRLPVISHQKRIVGVLSLVDIANKTAHVQTRH